MSVPTGFGSAPGQFNIKPQGPDGSGMMEQEELHRARNKAIYARLQPGATLPGATDMSVPPPAPPPVAAPPKAKPNNNNYSRWDDVVNTGVTSIKMPTGIDQRTTGYQFTDGSSLRNQENSNNSSMSLRDPTNNRWVYVNQRQIDAVKKGGDDGAFSTFSDSAKQAAIAAILKRY